jgi:hypothetical protein
MGSVSASVDVDTDVLDAIRSTVGQSAPVMETLVRRRVRNTRSQIKAELKAPNEFPELPFVWSYDPAAQARARRWYFANKVPKGSKGGRYQRTGDIEAAWDITFVDDVEGASIQLENDAPGAEYVYGDKQVPSHYLTGWGQIDEIASRYQDEFNLGLIEDWFTASGPFAGVR